MLALGLPIAPSLGPWWGPKHRAGGNDSGAISARL